MSGSDNDSVDMTRPGSPVHHRKKHNMESSRSPRSSRPHHSRSRSRSREGKRDRKNKRSRTRSKEARKRDSEKPSKSHRKTDEQQEAERLSAEDGDERSRRKDRKPSKGRSSASRSHSRERRPHSKSKDKRRSRSRSRDRKKKSAKSRSGSRTKHRHHSRSRSKSRERKKRSEKVLRKSRSRSVNPPAFRGRNPAMDAQEALARRLERAKKLQEQKEKEMLEQQQQEITAVSAPIAATAAAALTSNPALNVAALLASGTQVTPQIAMAAQMAALQAKTLAETGIAVPSFYNPSAVNPMKFAEQEKKRKMLWQGKKEGDKSQTAELWEKLNFGNKNQNVKFRKLMGIKGEDEVEPEVAQPLNEEGLKTLQKQEEMFRNLDVQYEMARSQTHTQRGMGLGFGSSFSRGMDSI
ncbi:arginine/serine-rich coiled-coil protein 2 isoform X2 [Notothenia coriiceps]|uniref:Arginine/serine-rich coiled-coil protein 2 n=1 Tax=Notothenia coriiceps TaxID=8208 RepID=A0A6I9N957_9TELE|nr:PREDICTED: arginine/serine-rich coiled-coil protein 2 isoform X2 [Notothenia coriiceps]